MLQDSHPRSLRGVSGDDPEGGAGSGVLRRAARNRSPREAGTPPSRHYDLGARSSLHGSARQMLAVVGRRAPKETEARPREPKTATVERREASVPRHKRVHARLDALWDARRLARRLAYRVMIRPTGVPPSTRTFLGAPPTPRFGVSEATMQTPGAKCAAGRRECVLEGGSACCLRS
jgi:hypothetical protein